jgi:2-methylaconitate cis-trans-isomerase PrpF
VGIESGALLPTGNVMDKISVPGIGEIDASFVDSGNPAVFIRAVDIGLKGTELPAEIDADHKLLEKLEEIRGIAGEVMGIIKDRRKSRVQNRNHPLLAFVAPPVDYRTFSGKHFRAEDYDFSSRIMYMQITHKTYPGSGTLCTGTAALIEGTVVNQLMKQESLDKKRVRIGHPGGIIEPESDVEKIGDKFVVTKNVFYRTARKIMDGEVYVRRKIIE